MATPIIFTTDGEHGKPYFDYSTSVDIFRYIYFDLLTALKSYCQCIIFDARMAGYGKKRVSVLIRDTF